MLICSKKLGSKVKQNFRWKGCQLWSINYSVTILYYKNEVLKIIEFDHTCLICWDEMMMSLESEVSGASLSDSATIKNVHHHYNCLKMTKADSCEITELKIYTSYYTTFVTCVFFFNTLMRFSNNHGCFQSTVKEYLPLSLLSSFPSSSFCGTWSTEGRSWEAETRHQPVQLSNL